MIQFNRYRAPDETLQFHKYYSELVAALAQEIDGDCPSTIGRFMRMAETFPLSDRLPLFIARMFYWGKVDFNFVKQYLPKTLPFNFFGKQELTGCLGLEHSHNLWGVDYNTYQIYQGKPSHPDVYFYDDYEDYLVYKPPHSGFFSNLENLINASWTAHRSRRKLLVSNAHFWWSYSPAFEDVFGDVWETTKEERPEAVLDFATMRHDILHEQRINVIDEFMSYKIFMYQKIYKAMFKHQRLVNFDFSNGIFYLRGGDKILLETIHSPTELLRKNLIDLKRRVQGRVVLSDEWKLAEQYAQMDTGVRNITRRTQNGYFHDWKNITDAQVVYDNFYMMCNAADLVACPSTNFINAVMWNRDDVSYSTISPVHRYIFL